MEKLLGFGLMRLPMLDNGNVDVEQVKDMVDMFMKEGFNYFDTAHGYIDGKSETAIKEALTSRYKRDEYILTNKLSPDFWNKESDIKPLIEKQLEICGVDYFDYLLMHAQNRNLHEKYMNNNAYGVVKELINEGKVKHLGISFHDSADVLDKILTDQPDIEIVQIQLNYLDYDSSNIQSKRVYDVCRKHNKKILIMEPVKGGALVNLPDDAKKVFDDLNSDLSYASYAIRFAASHDGVYKVLSGMSSIDQMKDNLSFMKDFKKLSDEEKDAIDKVTYILKNQKIIECTNCRYCVAGCPKSIEIPELFKCYNDRVQYKDWNSNKNYDEHTKDKGKASDCIKCGKCERTCPQHLEIRKYLETISKMFEK